MRLLVLIFSCLFLTLIISCSADGEKAPTKAASGNTVTAKEQKEMIQLDSLSQKLEKASSDIDKKVDELDAALEGI